MKRSGGVTSRVPRPNTLNVDLNSPTGGGLLHLEPRGTPKSAGALGPTGAGVIAGNGGGLLPRSAQRTGQLSHRASSPPVGSSFNGELERFLAADQASLSQPGSAGSGLTGLAAKRAVAGRRQPSQAATGPTAGLPPAKGASSGAHTARGPRPRAQTVGGSGAYTARTHGKDAGASAAAAAAAAVIAAATAVSDESDSQSDSDEDGGQPNAVSVNAAAALYASLANGAHNNSSSNGHSHHSHKHAPPQQQLQQLSLQQSATSPPHSHSHQSPSSPPLPSHSLASGDRSTTSTSPPPLAHASGGAGGGIAGEKDPTLKWAAVDAFAISTPKQKTGSVLVLASHLTRSAATPHVLDRARAIYRWICENIVWVPPASALATSAGDNNGSNGPRSSPSDVSSPSSLRSRGVSEASAAAREAAKAAVEMKMELSNKARLPSSMLGDDSDAEDDDDVGDDMRTSGPGASMGSGASSGSSGTKGAAASVDVLTDVGEILRRRRANSNGMASLFQALADSAGIECVKIEGLGKGCGLIKVGERFDTGSSGEPVGNHFWNAIRLEREGQWALIDVSWSAGYIHGGRLEKTFSGCYFRTNSTIFALQHFPLRAHPPGSSAAAASSSSSSSSSSAVGRALSKSMSDFVRHPEKLQLLETGGSGLSGSGGSGTSSSLLVPKRCISKAQFEDAMMIERGYLDLGVAMLHPLGVHTVRHDTPLYTISLQAPNSLEFIVGLNMPNSSGSSYRARNSDQSQQGGGGGGSSRFIDQCWHVSYSPLADDPSQSRVDILFVFPYRGSYTATIRARRMNSKMVLSNFEDVIHYRVQATCGLFDIRKEPGVACGFLSKRVLVGGAGSEHEFESKFSLVRPLKGHFELGQSVKIGVVAPASVTRMVAVNNGRWIEMQATQLSNGGVGGALAAVSGSTTAAKRAPQINLQMFEGDLKLQRYTDIQVCYKTKGQQFNQLYRYGIGNEGGGGGDVSGGSSSSSFSSLSDEAGENKHGKVVLDSRGTCFEKRLHITALKLGKRSAALHFDTKAGTAVKAEVRAGWSSAVKVADKITVTQTGNRAASDARSCACITQPCSHTGTASVSGASFDLTSWEVATQLAEAGDYSIHLFLSSQGSGVYRFALVLYIRIGDKAGFNLDVQ